MKKTKIRRTRKTGSITKINLKSLKEKLDSADKDLDLENIIERALVSVLTEERYFRNKR